MCYKNILEELSLIKKSITELEKNRQVIGDWIPKKVVMKFFDYGDTQMRELKKEKGLITTTIKARTFYSVQSILNLLEANKTNN